MLENLQGSSLNRRSFLRGSAMFAAAVGLAVVPAFAQQEQKPKPEEGEKREEPRDPFGDDKKNDNKLIDAEGREYVDLVGAWGPMILGHAHPAVVAAVQEAAAGSFS